MLRLEGVLQETGSSVRDFLVVLVEFVFAMKDRLRNINENSYNNFTMQVGQCVPGTSSCHQGFDWIRYCLTVTLLVDDRKQRTAGVQGNESKHTRG